LILIPGTTILTQSPNEWIDQYNITWTSQSRNSSESMPVGGGDIGCNVWVENGDILFYMSRSGEKIRLFTAWPEEWDKEFMDKNCSFYATFSGKEASSC
jgi:hypothetical protein